jgi:hypothetical protein
VVDNGGAPMAIVFEAPNGQPDLYPGVGLSWDYYAMSHIPSSSLFVLDR